MNKIPLLLSISCFVIYRFLLNATGNFWLSLSIFLLPIGLLLLNFGLRKKLNYANWFLSPMNVFLERTSYSNTSEIDAELLYAKLLEVSADSEFKLLDRDDNSSRLLLGTSANFWTWGENIYIHVVPSGDESVIQFTSVTLFGTRSWKRNEQNFQSFVESFESSLIL